MEWPEFLENSKPRNSTFDLFNATPHGNCEVTAQAAKWTPEEKQFFENAFFRYSNLDSQTFFEYAASKLPHKSMEEIKNHYITFFKNDEIENTPKHKDDDVVVVVTDDDHDQQHHQVPHEDHSSDKEVTLDGAPPQVENRRPRRRRGTPWTEGEHQLFLMGLNRYGKGDWKSISRHYVVSKTPTQVASHAQKYFSRRSSKTPVERRRPSINDIQTVTLNPRITTTTHQIHENFERSNRGEASSSNLFIMGQNNNNNNNNLRRPVSPRPFLSMYLSSTRRNDLGV